VNQETVVFQGMFEHSFDEILRVVNQFRLTNFELILGDKFGVDYQGIKQIWFRSSQSNSEKHIFGYLELSQEFLYAPIPTSVKIVCCDPEVFYIWLELAQRLQAAFLAQGLGFDGPVPALDILKAQDENTIGEKSAFNAKNQILRPELRLQKPEKDDPIEAWLYYYHKRIKLRELNPNVPKYTLRELAVDSNRNYSSIRHAHVGCAICKKTSTNSAHL